MKSLVLQSVDVDILSITCEEKTSEDREWLRERALTRAPDDPYFLLLNSDVLFETNGDIQELIDYLEANQDYAAVAYDTRNRSEGELVYVDIACMLVRNNVMQKIRFHGENFNCTCNQLRDDVQKLGYKIGYLKTHVLQEIREPFRRHGL